MAARILLRSRRYVRRERSGDFQEKPLTMELQVIGPKYSPDALEATLARFFQDTEFQSALTPLLISSYDLQSQLPFFFKSHRIAGDASYNWKVADVAGPRPRRPPSSASASVRGNQDYAWWTAESLSTILDGCLRRGEILVP